MFAFALAPLLGTVLAAPTVIERRQDCALVLLVHAAGTSEEGFGAVGKPLDEGLATVFSSYTSQALNYSTSVEYFITVTEGAKTLATLLTSQSTSCPDQKFILSGYSKGAMVIHNTNLTSTVQSSVCGIAVFGDPDDKAGLGGILGLADKWPIDNSSSVISFCNDNDIVCDGGLSGDAHTAYPTDGSVDKAVEFLSGVCP
ncbi:carbohydrate esterase family 5 protein [Cylindrobasidium torrendii FP15055 ss-10]|uniref:Carbohydrate esterase family 5 protein n=1 Tax=Cylindrobasidium torrendii FP15055 ss-10 TaxID=1314674 RepID=A0A0D7BLH6_9AGAR|nr:carbohydrate esterase family 5 protein [Cylindrobasidium torrendii FP15055 ss-10]